MQKIRVSVDTAIKDAFLDLLCSKEFESITVREICERAGVGRSTFYVHFKKLDNVVDAVLNDMFSQMDPLCGKYLGETEAERAHGAPPCEFLRYNRRYLALFTNRSLNDYTFGRTSRFFELHCQRWQAAMGADGKLTRRFMPFFLYGCLEATIHNMDLPDDQ